MLRCIELMNKHRMEINEICMNFYPFLSINQSCDDVVQWTKKQLMRAGLHLVQTFDLHTARTALQKCPCPNHGTDECDCQMVVILVYDDSSLPETLILHGNGDETWLSIIDMVTPDTNTTLAEVIKDILTSQ